MSTGITDLSLQWANFVPVDIKGGYIDSGLVGNNEASYSLNGEHNQLRAYRECSPLKSIISKRAKAFNNGEISIVDSKDKEITNPSATDVLDKLNNPNPLQTGRQFMAQQNSYLDIFGWALMLIIRPVGYTSKITNILNIPTWMLDPSYTKQWLYETDMSGIIQSFKFTFAGSVIELPPEDFALIFDDGFGTDADHNMLIPDSRLVGHEDTISLIRGGKKGAVTVINKRGAIGIFSNKTSDAGSSIPMKNGEKEAFQRELRRYGIAGQAYQHIVTDSNLEWQQIGMKVADMQIIELKSDAVMELCDTYGYPYRLLASKEAGGIGSSDVSEFRKDFYSDTIIPESLSRWEQRTTALLAGTGWKFKCDFSNLPALQDDKQKAATARKTQIDAIEKEFKNNLITLDRSRVLMGEESVGDKFGLLYYTDLIKLGFEFGNTGLTAGDVNSTTPPNVGTPTTT